MDRSRQKKENRGGRKGKELLGDKKIRRREENKKDKMGLERRGGVEKKERKGKRKVGGY